MPEPDPSSGLSQVTRKLPEASFAIAGGAPWLVADVSTTKAGLCALQRMNRLAMMWGLMA
jgi:hypothetical protein